MNSEIRSRTDECFVYIALPGEATFVPCGRFAMDVDRHGIAIGRFVYGKSYLARDNAVPIDPGELKLTERVYETRALRGVFGSIRDASPDYWGRRVIEKYAGLGAFSELEYLLHSPDDRAGALSFGLKVEPPPPRRTFNRTLDLARLQSIAEAIIAEEDVPPTSDSLQTETLLLAGTSMGEARPKAVVEDREALWIAKFNRADD